MKYEVKKEFILTANEGEMEMLAKAVSDQIIEMAKEVAESGELIVCPDPAFKFIEVTASEWFCLLDDICDALGNTQRARIIEIETSIEAVRNIFEKDKERREHLAYSDLNH